MTSEQTAAVNIEKIMAEIRAEVEKNGPYEDLPSFDEIPIPRLDQPTAPAALGGSIAARLADVEIPPVYPIPAGNPLKRLYKRVVAKVVRCATFPITVRATETNRMFRDCLNQEAAVIEEQQRQIEALKDRIERLEARLTVMGKD